MEHLKYVIKKIYQVDPFAFQIEWADGITQLFSLSELQKKCPCASCVDEVTGQRKVDENDLKKDVKAKYVENVGRYALRIQFTSGCSSGIFSFDKLREEFSS